jgi:methylmalonyl-CoA mutase
MGAGQERESESGQLHHRGADRARRRPATSAAIIGVNTFRKLHADTATPQKIELQRSSEEEKQSQLKRLADFHTRDAKAAPKALEQLKRSVIEDGNV